MQVELPENMPDPVNPHDNFVTDKISLQAFRAICLPCPCMRSDGQSERGSVRSTGGSCHRRRRSILQVIKDDYLSNLFFRRQALRMVAVEQDDLDLVEEGTPKMQIVDDRLRHDIRGCCKTKGKPPLEVDQRVSNCYQRARLIVKNCKPAIVSQFDFEEHIKNPAMLEIFPGQDAILADIMISLSLWIMDKGGSVREMANVFDVVKYLLEKDDK